MQVDSAKPVRNHERRTLLLRHDLVERRLHDGSVQPSRTPKPVRRDESNDSLVKQLTQRLGFAFP